MPGKRRQPSPNPAARQGLRVVGIGASAGGLEACRHLVEALAPGAGIGFILVQHLDPAQESLLVDLLTSHTKLTVVEAADGMLVQPDQVAVIPPGSYLSVSGGRLRLSKPGVRHGARMPFDSCCALWRKNTARAPAASCCPARERMAAWGWRPSMRMVGW